MKRPCIQTDPDCQWLQRTWDDHGDYIRQAAAITDKLEAQAVSQLAAAVQQTGRRIVVFNPLPRTRDAIVEVGDTRTLVKDLPPSGYATI